MKNHRLGTLQVLLIGLYSATASGESPIVNPRSGSYSIRLVDIRSRGEAVEGGAKLPFCGEEARSIFDSMARLVVVFNSRKGTAVVNGDEWTIFKNGSGTFATTSLTICTSLTLKILLRGSTGRGVLLYRAKCAERPACASIADYKGTFSSK